MSEAQGTASWRVEEEHAGLRLDRAVALWTDSSRNRVQQWIRDGRVLVNGKQVKASAVLFPGDQVDARPPEASDPRLQPEEGALDLLYEDADLVVLNKAAGIAVHPGAGRPDSTLANRLLHRYPEIAAVGGPGRPGIVHRLDLDTTGALVVARSELAYRELSVAFAERRVEKTYLAIAHGKPRASQGTIDQPIGRHPTDRKRMTVRPGGRPARTHYRTVAYQRGICLLELGLESGRTHQIRVHLKSAHHPLVGDPVYGEERWRELPKPQASRLRAFARPALHAWRLAFAHPRQGRRLALEAPVPEDLQQLWRSVTGESWPSLPPDQESFPGD